MFCSNFNFTMFSLIFFPFFPKVFTSILKIYELLKIYHKIPYCQIYTCLNNNELQGQFCPNFIWRLNYTSISFVENMPQDANYSFGTKLKQNPRQDISLKCSAKSLFLLHQILSLFSTINLVYVLNINFKFELSLPQRLISSKHTRFIVYCRQQRQYLMQLDVLEKKCDETASKDASIQSLLKIKTFIF